MRTVAKRKDENVFLIIPLDDLEAASQERRLPGRVYYPDKGLLGPPMNAHSLVTKTQWEDVDLDDAATRAMLAGVTRIQGPGIDEPWLLPSQAFAARRDAEAAAEVAA